MHEDAYVDNFSIRLSWILIIFRHRKKSTHLSYLLGISSVVYLKHPQAVKTAANTGGNLDCNVRGNLYSIPEPLEHSVEPVHHHWARDDDSRLRSSHGQIFSWEDPILTDGLMAIPSSENGAGRIGNWAELLGRWRIILPFQARSSVQFDFSELSIVILISIYLKP